MRTTILLTLKQHRMVLWLLVIGTAVLALATVVGDWAMGALVESADYKRCMALSEIDPACEALGVKYTLAMIAVAIGGLGPWVLVMLSGLLLGIPLVANEIDHGTAVLAWSMAPSRSRWFMTRVAILAVVLVICGTVLAFTSTQAFVAGRTDRLDPNLSFDAGSIFGFMVPVRGLVAMAAGMFVGALLGRLFPTVIAGTALAAALLWGINGWSEMDVHSLPPLWLGAADGELARGSITTDWYVGDLETGEIITQQEFWSRYEDQMQTLDWSTVAQYSMGIPGSVASDIRGRQAAVLVLAADILLFGALVRVERRRPY